MQSWGAKGKGFDVVPYEGKALKFKCGSAEAEEICAAMRQGATALGKRIKAKKKADDLENKIKSDDYFTELREALKEVEEQDEKPYQQFFNAMEQAMFLKANKVH